MHPKTLLAIKTEIGKFHKLYEKLVDLWNGEAPYDNGATYPVTVLVNVIVHNMAFISTNCHGYNHKKDVEELRKNLEMLRLINEYENKCYMTHYAYNEVNNIYEGNLHMEDENHF